MRLAKITTLYPVYLNSFYLEHPGLAGQPYDRQKEALEYDASGLADFWSHALEPLGYEVLEVSYNAEPLQRAWARENIAGNHKGARLKAIAVEQVRKFQPDILWFDDYDDKLLLEMKAAAPSIKLVLGWSGSAIFDSAHWKYLDVALSCAQESVDFLRGGGVRAEQLHHGFDPRVNERLVQRDKIHPLTFIGQLIRSSQFHLQREQFLLELSRITEIAIFSASARLGVADDVKAVLAVGIYRIFTLLQRLGVGTDLLAALPRIGWLATADKEPLHRAVNPGLKPYLRLDVHGLQMFQVLKDSAVVLNIHADSSPRFASNMRLFETTGVGACMVADWKENLPELFVPDEEVVTYKSPEECLEKVRWLEEHPRERDSIALAAQRRTLNCHTFAHRAVELDGIIRKAMP